MLNAYNYMEWLQKDYAVSMANVLYAVAIEPSNYKNGVFKQYDEIVLYFRLVNDFKNKDTGFYIEGRYKNDNKNYGSIMLKFKMSYKGR